MSRHGLMTVLSMLCNAAWMMAAHGNMAIDRNIIYFEPGDPPSVDVTVANRNAEPLFVETQVVEVLKPGTPEENRVTVTADHDLPLLVSPGKLILGDGHKKLLRIVNLAGHGKSERVFRVTVRPVPAPAETKSSGIRLFVAYEVLVIIAPREAVPDLRSHWAERQLVFENHGNTNVLLHSGKQCPGVAATPKGTTCVAFRGTRLYPGNTWTLRTPYQTPVEFVIAEGEKSARRTF